MDVIHWFIARDQRSGIRALDWLVAVIRPANDHLRPQDLEEQGFSFEAFPRYAVPIVSSGCPDTVYESVSLTCHDNQRPQGSH